MARIAILEYEKYITWQMQPTQKAALLIKSFFGIQYMQKTIESINEIEKDIFKKLADIEGQSIIISIDGKDGSGKSHLALCLCCRNENFIYFDLDTHYWSSKKLPYVENIDYEILKNNIHNTLSDNEIVVIDGVCMLSILEKLSLNPTIAIYIKKVNDSGWWIDGKEFNYDLDLEEVFENKREVSRKWSELEGFDQNRDLKSVTDIDISYEIIRYHFRHKPDKNADIIYELISKPSA